MNDAQTVEEFLNDESNSVNKRIYDEVNTHPLPRWALEERYGRVWDRGELLEEFRLLAHRPPSFLLERKCDGMECIILMQDDPQFFFRLMTRDEYEAEMEEMEA